MAVEIDNRKVVPTPISAPRTKDEISAAAAVSAEAAASTEVTARAAEPTAPNSLGQALASLKDCGSAIGQAVEKISGEIRQHFEANPYSTDQEQKEAFINQVKERAIIGLIAGSLAMLGPLATTFATVIYTLRFMLPQDMLQRFEDQVRLAVDQVWSTARGEILASGGEIPQQLVEQVSKEIVKDPQASVAFMHEIQERISENKLLRGQLIRDQVCQMKTVLKGSPEISKQKLQEMVLYWMRINPELAQEFLDQLEAELGPHISEKLKSQLAEMRTLVGELKTLYATMQERFYERVKELTEGLEPPISKATFHDLFEEKLKALMDEYSKTGKPLTKQEYRKMLFAAAEAAARELRLSGEVIAKLIERFHDQPCCKGVEDCTDKSFDIADRLIEAIGEFCNAYYQLVILDILNEMMREQEESRQERQQEEIAYEAIVAQQERQADIQRGETAKQQISSQLRAQEIGKDAQRPDRTQTRPQTVARLHYEQSSNPGSREFERLLAGDNKQRVEAKTVRQQDRQGVENNENQLLRDLGLGPYTT